MRHRLFLLIVLLAVISYLRSPAAEDRALAALVVRRRAADTGRRSTLDEAEGTLFP